MFEKISNKINRVKLAREISKDSTKMFKSLCIDCQRLAIQNNRRPIEDYCPKCTITMKEFLHKIEMKVKRSLE